jgi:hypothetical protein
MELPSSILIKVFVDLHNALLQFFPLKEEIPTNKLLLKVLTTDDFVNLSINS